MLHCDSDIGREIVSLDMRNWNLKGWYTRLLAGSLLQSVLARAPSKGHVVEEMPTELEDKRWARWCNCRDVVGQT